MTFLTQLPAPFAGMSGEKLCTSTEVRCSGYPEKTRAPRAGGTLYRCPIVPT